MTRRSLTTGVSLTVGVVLLCIMAVWGYHAVTSPIADGSGSSGSPTCKPEDQQVAKFLQRKEVTVSVYNAGKTSGRAQQTMGLLERAGFKPGAVGNAPEGITVKRAAVYTTKSDDPAAEHDALQQGADEFGRGTTGSGCVGHGGDAKRNPSVGAGRTCACAAR